MLNLHRRKCFGLWSQFSLHISCMGGNFLTVFKGLNLSSIHVTPLMNPPLQLMLVLLPLVQTAQSDVCYCEASQKIFVNSIQSDVWHSLIISLSAVCHGQHPVCTMRSLQLYNCSQGPILAGMKRGWDFECEHTIPNWSLHSNSSKCQWGATCAFTLQLQYLIILFILCQPSCWPPVTVPQRGGKLATGKWNNTEERLEVWVTYSVSL